MDKQTQWQHRANQLLQIACEYTDKGYELYMPSDIRSQSPGVVEQTARDCLAVLDGVFRGQYPLSQSYSSQLASSVEAGTTHLFALRERNSGVVATAAVVEKPNVTDGAIRRAELGRVGKLPEAPSLKSLVRGRVDWVLKHAPHLDFLYSSMRSTLEPSEGVPSGQHIMGVWLGENRGPVVPNHVGWFYRIGNLDSFMNVCIPNDPKKWSEAVSKTTVFVPGEVEKQILDTLLHEGTYGQARPNVRIHKSGKRAEHIPLHRVNEPSDVAVTDYVVSNRVNQANRTNPAAADADLLEGISQRVTIEHDLSSTPEGANIVRTLQEQGWTMAGWRESELALGGLAVVMARVNPKHLLNLNAAGHTPELFDKHGLTGTKRIFDDVYKEMAYVAARHPEAKLAA